MEYFQPMDIFTNRQTRSMPKFFFFVRESKSRKRESNKEKLQKKKEEDTTPRFPTWSPTVVLREALLSLNFPERNETGFFLQWYGRIRNLQRQHQGIYTVGTFARLSPMQEEGLVGCWWWWGWWWGKTNKQTNTCIVLFGEKEVKEPCQVQDQTLEDRC